VRCGPNNQDHNRVRDGTVPRLESAPGPIEVDVKLSDESALARTHRYEWKWVNVGPVAVDRDTD
jgi:hypothetical protein